MSRYPMFLPAVIAFPAAVVLLWFALAEEVTGAPAALRRLLGVAAAGALVFSAYGVARTLADHYEHLCVVHHADNCGSQTLGAFLYRHLP